MDSIPHRRAASLCASLVLLVNLIIAAPLFTLEYTSYSVSIEGTFIAIPRIMAKYPGQWSWWPFWNGGIPFETAYLPFSHWLVAAFTLLSGLSAARSFHIVTAALYSLGAVAVFWLAWDLSRKLASSFIASLAYSSLSLSAILVPKVMRDAGGALSLRRFQDLAYYGESPHTVALVLMPVTILLFHRAITRPQPFWKIAAGAFAAFVVLSNAFGIVTLAVSLLCLLFAYPGRPWWKPLTVVAAIGTVSFCWITPWLSPAMIRAIRENSPTTGGDYRYNLITWFTFAALIAGFVLLAWFLRRRRFDPHLQFFLLWPYFPTAFIALWYTFKIAIVPQPSRYELEFDLTLTIAVVFLSAILFARLPAKARRIALPFVGAALAAQAVHAGFYAWDHVRPADPQKLGEFRVTRWLDQNRPGELAFVSGAATWLYNDISDNPQLRGGHDQHIVNTFLPIVQYAVYSGENAGDRDAWYSIFWLKAFGVHLISVPGPDSDDPYKPFAHPHKFDGLLPLVWRDHGDSIYEVQPRSTSLAHVIPSTAVIARRPIHGLDTAPVEPYVAALDDSTIQPATFRWTAMDRAAIHAQVNPGQVVSVQVSYARGWEAWANGRPQRIRGDAIGQMVIDSDCTGQCDLTIQYTGGRERTITRLLSLLATLIALIYLRVG